MKRFVVSLLFVSFFGLQNADQLMPKFSWLSERSASGVPFLSIKLGDEDLTAVLDNYNPIPMELLKSRSEVDDCIFKGHLLDDPETQVLVTGGCAGDDSFDIAMSGKMHSHFRFNVRNGVAKPLKNRFGTPITLKDGSKGIFRDRAVPTHQFQPKKNVTSNRAVALPTQGFVFKLAIIYDKYWLAKYVTDAEAVKAIGRVMANTQIIFNWPSLTVPITLQVASITFQNIAIPADVPGLDALIPFATDSTMGVYVGMTNFGDYGGIAYQPAVCGNMAQRTAVVKNGYSDMETAETMAHELGHNLGMNHDFIDPYTSPKTIFRDAAGNTCTDVNGVMDYYVTVQKWTTCSVERMTQHYNNVVSSAGSFCLPLSGTSPVNGNWGAWSAWSACTKPCASGTQSRTRVCNSPAPSNGGAACVGSASGSQACNTQACPVTAVVALVGGTGPFEGVLYATNPATGIYGPVCDDYFTLSAATVVCKQLKFPSAKTVTCCSSKGSVPTNFSYDDVKCVGTEKTLNACPHVNVHNCGSNEGLWIVCNQLAG